MRLRFILSLSASAFIICCTNPTDKGYNLVNSKSDTTELFRIWTDSALNNQLIPEFKRLRNKGIFDDTFFFKFDKRLEKNLPFELKYKLLTETEICLRATKYLKVTNEAFNYLELYFFKKTDSSYSIGFTNMCLRGLEDEDTRVLENEIITCEYEKYCNGGLEIDFSNRNRLLKPIRLTTPTW